MSEVVVIVSSGAGGSIDGSGGGGIGVSSIRTGSENEASSNCPMNPGRPDSKCWGSPAHNPRKVDSFVDIRVRITGLLPGKFHEPPADHLFIPAVLGLAENTLQHVVTQCLEEFRRLLFEDRGSERPEDSGLDDGEDVLLAHDEKVVLIDLELIRADVEAVTVDSKMRKVRDSRTLLIRIGCTGGIENVN